MSESKREAGVMCWKANVGPIRPQDPVEREVDAMFDHDWADATKLQGQLDAERAAHAELKAKVAAVKAVWDGDLSHNCTNELFLALEKLCG